MTEKFKILAKYIKDLSSETPDIETFLFVKDNISKYQLNIDITSKALKNKLVEVNTTLKFEDKEPNEKKSYYEIVYATIIKVEDRLDTTVNAIDQAIKESNIVLVSGGISVGDYDFVGKAIEKLCVDQLFYKVRQRPGKPLFFGKKKDFIEGEYEDIEDNNDRKI